MNTQISDDSTEEAKVAELSLWGYFVKCLKSYAAFSGRARRREFWGFYLFYTLGMVLSCVISFSMEWIIVILLYWLVLLLPRTAVFVRRMHDVGKSGWRVLYVQEAPPLAVFAFWMVILRDAGDGLMFAIPVLVLPTVVLAGLITNILMIWWAYPDSEPGPNKYGENPKGQ